MSILKKIRNTKLSFTSIKLFYFFNKYLYFFSFLINKDHEDQWILDNSGTNSNYTKFIILTTARSGSNWLGMLLNSHSCILSFLELFHRNGVFHPAFRPNEKESPILVSIRNRSPMQFLNKFVFRALPDTYKAVGFKIFFEHMELPENRIISEYLIKNKDIKIIFLIRENLLSSYLSKVKALMTNTWLINDKKNSSKFSVTINPIKAKKFFEKQINYQEKYKGIFDGHNILFLTYEMMNNDIEKVNQDIFNFLQINHETLSTRTKKQSSSSFKEQINNYDKLKHYFRDTKYACFFNEP